MLGCGLLGPRALPLLLLQVFWSPEGVCETVQHPARVRGLRGAWGFGNDLGEGGIDFRMHEARKQATQRVSDCSRFHPLGKGVSLS